MGARLIRQTLQGKEAKEYDDTDANKAGILEWMRKNDNSSQDHPTQKPNRPKSIADDNPSDPSDDSSTSSNNTRSSDKSNKSGKSVPSSLAPAKPDTVSTKESERLRAKQLEEKPYKADENELKTFRQIAEEV